MATTLNALMASKHVADLRRSAAQHRFGNPSLASVAAVVTVRPANAGDVGALHVLAELDEQPELAGDVLLALIDDHVVAAISLAEDRVIANPFVATRDAVALLKLRAQHVVGAAVRHPRRRWRLRAA